MRYFDTFLALEPSEGFAAQCREIIQQLSRFEETVWQDPNTLHLRLKHMGTLENDEERLRLLDVVEGAVSEFGAFEYRFGKLKRQTDGEIVIPAADVQIRLRILGVSLKLRLFGGGFRSALDELNPRILLGGVRFNAPNERGLLKAIDAIPSLENVPCAATHISLFATEKIRDDRTMGKRYRLLARVPLQETWRIKTQPQEDEFE